MCDKSLFYCISNFKKVPFYYKTITILLESVFDLNLTKEKTVYCDKLLRHHFSGLILCLYLCLHYLFFFHDIHNMKRGFRSVSYVYALACLIYFIYEYCKHRTCEKNQQVTVFALRRAV